MTCHYILRQCVFSPALESRRKTPLSHSNFLSPFITPSLSLPPQLYFRVPVRLGFTRYFLDRRRDGKPPAPLLHQRRHRVFCVRVPNLRTFHRRSHRSDDALPSPPLVWLHPYSSTTSIVRVLC